MYFDETKYRQCKRCSIIKPFSEYPKSKTTVSGTLLFCKQCATKAKKIYYLEKRCNDEERAKQRRWCQQYRDRKRENTKMLSL